MSKTIKLITYNIDGLPEQLDLNALLWLFKPIAWIYKLIKGTTIITINDNKNKKNLIDKIGEYLFESNSDIIGIQEDFNYHDEIVGRVRYNYICGTYSGGFDLSKIFSKVELLTHFPLPRFKCDGINLLAKKGRVEIKNEEIVKWRKCYGYLSHANDLLTHKGFRFYTVTVDNEVDIDVYIVHMDADFYNAEKCPNVRKDIIARKSQFKQLVNHIAKTKTNNPIIIMGDTNSYDIYNWDKENIIQNLIIPIDNIDTLEIKEVIPNNHKDCDRIYIVNNVNSKYILKAENCYFDTEMHMSDHKPLIAILNVEVKNN